MMLFGSPDEALKAPTDLEFVTEFGSPQNVCDLFGQMDMNRQTTQEIGAELTTAGHDHMQIANCLVRRRVEVSKNIKRTATNFHSTALQIIRRPKTTEEAKAWIHEHKDTAASTHIAGQKVPDSWAEGVEFNQGSADREFALGEVVVLKRSDGSFRFGLVQQLQVVEWKVVLFYLSLARSLARSLGLCNSFR